MLIPKGGYQTYNQMVDRVRNRPEQVGNASYTLGNYYPQINDDDDDDEFDHSFDGAVDQYAAPPVATANR